MALPSNVNTLYSRQTRIIITLQKYHRNIMIIPHLLLLLHIIGNNRNISDTIRYRKQETYSRFNVNILRTIDIL